MSIIVHSTILERLDTTESWEYTNPILANREQGYEVDIYENPVGMKIGDGVTHWDDLPYWFTTAGSTPPVPPIVRNITGGVTTIPQTYAHPGMVWPTVMFRDGSGNTYGGAFGQDTGTDIVVSGDDDGSGKFADSFIVIIKA
jgi:hypothetical protein